MPFEPLESNNIFTTIQKVLVFLLKGKLKQQCGEYDMQLLLHRWH